LSFNPKVSTIEEMKDIENLKMDKLHGILTAYEMKIGKTKSEQKEVAFKALKQTKGHNDHDQCSPKSYEGEV